MHWGNDWTSWWWMPVAMLVYWSVAVLVIVLIARAFRPSPTPTSTPRDPAHVLDDRYARGEIDEEEYRRRRSTMNELRGR